MKYTVYCKIQHSESSKQATIVHNPHEVKHCIIEADSFLDAMAKFSKEEKKLMKDNIKLGWTITETTDGYTEELHGMKTTYSNFRFVAEPQADSIS